MKKCTNCQQEKSLSEFNKHRSTKDGHQWFCKECGKEINRLHYSQNKNKYVGYGKSNRERMRQWYIDLKKQYTCAHCAEDKYWRLTFHHLDPKQKSFVISEAAGRTGKVSQYRIMEEIKKCVVLCHNCHADIHHNERIK